MTRATFRAGLGELAKTWTEEQHATAWTLADTAYRSYKRKCNEIAEGVRVGSRAALWEQTCTDLTEALAMLGLFEEPQERLIGHLGDPNS